VHRAIDQDLAPGQLELRQLDLQTRADLVDRTVHLAPEVPAHARQQQPVEHRRQREHHEHGEKPRWNRHAPGHARTFVGFSLS
jgi:hypothetical protein